MGESGKGIRRASRLEAIRSNGRNACDRSFSFNWNSRCADVMIGLGDAAHS